MRLFFAMGLLLVLAGCETMEYGNRCSEYGFVRGTESHANCVQRLDMSREYRRGGRFDAPQYDYY
jgi:hypothetical protein